jgi:hypothetical protein
MAASSPFGPRTSGLVVNGSRSASGMSSGVIVSEVAKTQMAGPTWAGRCKWFLAAKRFPPPDKREVSRLHAPSKDAARGRGFGGVGDSGLGIVSSTWR